MKLVLNLFLILSISVATGTCLVCERCENLHGDACNKTQTSTEVCAHHVTQCRTTIMVETFGNVSYWQSWKSCANNPILCRDTFNMSVGYELFKKTVCCEGDLCNKGAIKLDAINRTENGVMCPSCYAKAGKSCKPTEMRKCQGHQTACHSFSGLIFNSTQFEPWAYQGCTTENTCHYRPPPYPETLFQKGFRLSCVDSKNSKYKVKY